MPNIFEHLSKGSITRDKGSCSGAIETDYSEHIALNEKSFFPNLYSDLGCEVRIATQHFYSSGYVGRFILKNTSTTSEAYYTIRWEYVT